MWLAGSRRGQIGECKVHGQDRERPLSSRRTLSTALDAPRHTISSRARQAHPPFVVGWNTWVGSNQLVNIRRFSLRGRRPSTAWLIMTRCSRRYILLCCFNNNNKRILFTMLWLCRWIEKLMRLAGAASHGADPSSTLVVGSS